jgi:Tfp pilus assembly protein PilV
VEKTYEGGFTLLETLIAVALTTIAVLGVTGAVARALYGTARSETRLLLAADAANVLTDLRAASAYDPGMLARMSGQRVAVTLALPGAKAPRAVGIVATVSAQGASGTYVARVTATAADGTTVTQERTLVVEAPAPGSRVAPSPASTSAAPTSLMFPKAAL